ncbi:hypothetical protein EJ02DRAFT_51720 [Clathrospora elynae]|uniref:Uncharacterized protein n=1 Tax=Clathrospora elynae TaxID=706981 RepID=A0A6A5T0T5_9PLEO|nr:hypothetical protein EJ02DRAFT_51720 [Clathrospora elynae]
MKKYFPRTSDVESALFDRQVHLQRELKEHVVKKGSGIWGSELDTGHVLVLDWILICKTHRRQGLGQKLIQATLDKVKELVNGGPLHALVAPAPIAPPRSSKRLRCFATAKHRRRSRLLRVRRDGRATHRLPCPQIPRQAVRGPRCRGPKLTLVHLNGQHDSAHCSNGFQAAVCGVDARPLSGLALGSQ